MKEISQILKELFKKRKPDTHKGTFGHVSVIAGSVNLTGAAYLCCMGALRSGAGLITAFVPEYIKPVINILAPESLIHPLRQNKKGELIKKNYKHILNYVNNTDTCALGPGLGHGKDVSSLILKLIKKIKTPMIIDADGLNIISKKTKILNKTKSHLILTPHPGEMSRLIKKDINQIKNNREIIAKKFAKKYNLTLVLKGNKTIVASSTQENIWVNSTGNSGMATGGTGDILTGMIAAFIAQGIDSFEASRIAVYLHGLAADIAVEDKGKISLLPRDILDNIPAAIIQTEKNSNNSSTPDKL